MGLTQGGANAPLICQGGMARGQSVDLLLVKLMFRISIYKIENLALSLQHFKSMIYSDDFYKTVLIWIYFKVGNLILELAQVKTLRRIYSKKLLCKCEINKINHNFKKSRIQARESRHSLRSTGQADGSQSTNKQTVQ